MNIETKIKELDSQIKEQTKIERALSATCDEKDKAYRASLSAWSPVYNQIKEMETKREILIQMLKECACEIPKDEDIGRTVPLPPDVNGIGGVCYPDMKYTEHLINRVPIFKGDQEREFIEPK